MDNSASPCVLETSHCRALARGAVSETSGGGGGGGVGRLQQSRIEEQARDGGRRHATCVWAASLLLQSP